MIYGDLFYFFKEQVDFYHCRGVCTHTANTHLFKQHVKVNFA